MYRVEVKRTDNANKFREAALSFQKNGYYCAHPRGTTAYKKFWDEEARRCLNGYTTPDGEWISGYFYFYLNYSPIIKREEVTRVKNGKEYKKLESVRNFPDFWDYDRAFFDAVEEAENNNKHLTFLKPRGVGASFKGSSMLARNFFLVRESTSLAITEEQESLVKDGILTKCWDIVDFVNEHTAWSKKSQKINTKLHKRASLVINNGATELEVGYKSEVIGISVKNNPDKPRGKRFKLAIVDEIGLISSPIHLFSTIRHGAEEDGMAYGLIILQGTGGTQDADFSEMRRLFYEPDTYNFLEVENTWDEGQYGKACGFFWPKYYNMRGYMDENGNSDPQGAFKAEEAERARIIESASDRNQIDRHCAERPFVPEEALLQVSQNIFPKKELLAHLNYIRTHESLRKFKQVGDLNFDVNGVIKWDPAKKPKDLTSYRLKKEDDPAGQVVIWEHPCENPPYGLYVMGCLTPGEKVLTENGLKNVETIELSDKLINKDGDFVKINTLLKYDKNNVDIFKFKMSGINNTTTFTEEHPLYVSTSIDNKFDFVKVKDVRPGMYTKYPNVYNKTLSVDQELWNKYKIRKAKQIATPIDDPDFWWFVGLWLGDGFNCKGGRNYSIYMSFGNDCEEYIIKYKAVVSRLFNRKVNGGKKSDCKTNKFECTQLYNFLEDNFGKYADGKYVKEWVKYLPINLKIQLILGYLDSDGSVFKDRNSLRGNFTSINKRLLSDIQDILFSIGIVSRFTLHSNACEYNIKGKTGFSRESYCLKLSHEELQKLSSKYDDNYKWYSRKLKLIKDWHIKIKHKKNKECIISDDNRYIFIRIEDINVSKYTGPVYNFDCETHTYLCQYISTHNCDPYDHDQASTSTSLGSVFVYKRFQSFEKYYNLPVAEYTGRPETVDEFYENVRKLALYYNAKILYENEKKGLFIYFSHKHCEYLLADQPSIIRDIVQNSKVERGKGIHMNKEIKQYMELKLRDWLNEEYEPGKKNLTKILSEALLEELIEYNPEGNFDRVISFGLCILYNLEIHNIQVNDNKKENKKHLIFPEGLFKNNEDNSFIQSLFGDVPSITPWR